MLTFCIKSTRALIAYAPLWGGFFLVLRLSNNKDKWVRRHPCGSCTARIFGPLLSCDEQNSTSRNSWPQTFISTVLNECLAERLPAHSPRRSTWTRIIERLVFPGPRHSDHVSNWPASQHQSGALRLRARSGVCRTANLLTLRPAGAAVLRVQRPKAWMAARRKQPSTRLHRRSRPALT